MEREYNIFTKRVKKVMMLYSAIVSIVMLSLTNNIDNSIERSVRQEVKVANARMTSFQKPKIERIIPELQPVIVESTNEVVEEVEVVENEDDSVAQEISEEEVVVEDELVEEINEEPSVVEFYEEATSESRFSEDEIYLMAKVCLAEAEGESDYGKRLVVSTILNRIDSGYYSSNVYDVVYQPYQFEVTMNGRIDRVTVTDDIIQLVKEEIANRSNYDVIYFRTDHYSEYGTPLFVEDSHYFSGF